MKNLNIMSKVNKNIRLFLTVNIIASFAMGIFNMLIGIYLKELGYKEHFVGMVLSINTFSIALSSIPSAYLLEKIGRKKSLAIGFLCIAIGSSFIVLLNNKLLIIAMSILVGTGLSVKTTAEGMYITENTTEEERVFAFSVNFIIFNAGMMIASFIGGVLSSYISNFLTSAQSITLIFISSAILSMTGLIPIHFMKEPESLKPRSLKSCIKGYMKILNKKVLEFMTYNFLIGLGAGVVVPFFSVYLKYSMNIEDNIVGTILSISQFGCIVCGGLVPFLSNKLGKVKTVILCQILSIPFLVSIAFPQGLILVTISFFIRNGLMNMAIPLTQNLSMELVDKSERTNLSSFLSLSSNISRAMGIAIGGFMMEKISYNSPYYLTIVLYVMGIIIFSFIYKDDLKKEKIKTHSCKKVNSIG